MCRTVGQTMPINKYIENLPPDHPSSTIFNIARIAPEKTRGSLQSALTTLRLFTSKSIYGMTCKSDFSLNKQEKRKQLLILFSLMKNDLLFFSKFICLSKLCITCRKCR